MSVVLLVVRLVDEDAKKKRKSGDTNGDRDDGPGEEISTSGGRDWAALTKSSGKHTAHGGFERATREV